MENHRSIPFCAQTEGITIPEGEVLQQGPAAGTDSARWVYRGKQRKCIGDPLTGVFHIAFFGRPDLKKGIRALAVQPSGLGRVEKTLGNGLGTAGLMPLQIQSQRSGADAADPVFPAV